MKYSYVDALKRGFPNTQFTCSGLETVYENIVFIQGDPIPPKAILDNWMIVMGRADMWELIKAERDRRKSEGGYKVGSNWFHSDTTSRIQQMALVMMGASMPAGLLWKTMSGSFVTMTPTLAGQIFQAAAASDMAIFTIAEQKNAEMLTVACPSTYNYQTGWPVCYGE